MEETASVVGSGTAKPSDPDDRVSTATNCKAGNSKLGAARTTFAAVASTTAVADQICYARTLKVL